MTRSKITVFRAVSAAFLRRALLLSGVIGGIVSALLLLGIWALANTVSAWWWLLLILYIPLVLILLGIWLFVRFLAKRLYPEHLTHEQMMLLNSFIDKVQRLLETRGIGWPWFAVLSIKDALIHRDLRTVRNIISDTTSLRRDLAELERKL